MNELTLTLSLEEVKAILQVLGQLPTQSGAWPLMKKIDQQALEQIPQEPKAE